MRIVLATQVTAPILRGLVDWGLVFSGTFQITVGTIMTIGTAIAEAPTLGAATVGVIVGAGLIARGVATIGVGLATPGRTANPIITKSLMLSGKLLTPGGLVGESPREEMARQSPPQRQLQRDTRR